MKETSGNSKETPPYFLKRATFPARALRQEWALLKQYSCAMSRLRKCVQCAHHWELSDANTGGDRQDFFFLSIRPFEHILIC